VSTHYEVLRHVIISPFLGPILLSELCFNINQSSSLKTRSTQQTCCNSSSDVAKNVE